MARPSKSTDVIEQEKKSHRTKAELNQRKEAEKSLLSGVALKERPEVKGNPDAHTEFKRVDKLLRAINKNDAIYEVVINRYCTLQAECIQFEQKREKFYEQLDELSSDDKIDSAEKYKLMAQMQKTILDVDKQIQSKRKMLFDIERENGMTLAASLRSIPKPVGDTTNPLLEALKPNDPNRNTGQ